MKNNLEEVWREKMSIDMSSPIKFLRTMRLSHYEIPSDFMLDMHDQLDKLEQELQKTREQLSESNELLCFICRKLDEAVFDRQDKITIVTRSLLHKELIEYVSKYNAK